MYISRLPVVLLIFVLMLVSCADADDSQPIENETPVTEIESYPSPAVAMPVEAGLENEQAYPEPSPVENLESYPPPEANRNTIEGSYPSPRRIIDEEKRFAFDEPIVTGQEEVSGTGPANVPIKISSISFAGEELGRGTINEDKTFVISLSRPTEENEVLGIMLGDDSLRQELLDAPGTDIPLIGFILDQSVVEP